MIMLHCKEGGISEMKVNDAEINSKMIYFSFEKEEV